MDQRHTKSVGGKRNCDYTYGPLGDATSIRSLHTRGLFPKLPPCFGANNLFPSSFLFLCTVAEFSSFPLSTCHNFFSLLFPLLLSVLLPHSSEAKTDWKFLKREEERREGGPSFASCTSSGSTPPSFSSTLLFPLGETRELNEDEEEEKKRETSPPPLSLLLASFRAQRKGERESGESPSSPPVFLYSSTPPFPSADGWRWYRRRRSLDGFHS